MSPAARVKPAAQRLRSNKGGREEERETPKIEDKRRNVHMPSARQRKLLVQSVKVKSKFRAQRNFLTLFSTFRGCCRRRSGLGRFLVAFAVSADALGAGPLADQLHVRFDVHAMAG